MNASTAPDRVWFDVLGQGEMPLLLVGAEGLGRQAFNGVVPHLSERCRLLVHDLAGYGASGSLPPDESVECAAAHLEAVLDAAGWESAHVHGTSLGAQVALALALRAPERCSSLLLSAGFARADTYWRFLIEALHDHSEVAGMSRGVAAFVAERSFAPAALDERPELVGDVLLPLLQETPVRTWLASLRALVAFDCASALPSIALPTLVLAGEHDRALDLAPSGVGSRLIAELVPEARLVLLPGSGHFTTLDAPQAHADAMLDFLDRF